MEVMDFVLPTVQDISYLIIHHPIYSAVGSVFIFILLLKFYCRLTMGICDIEQDMSDKTVLITGASAGIGKATALELARRNARVLLACRNIEKANKVAEEIKSATGNQNVIVKCLDLSSFESVRKCARSVLETEDQLHILINNAGITGVSGQLTEDGCDLIMQSNYFGHFLFTLLLIDLLKRSSPSRIINVSSGAHHLARFDVDDLNNKKKQHPFYVYSNSKLANILFTRELADKLRDTGVTVNCLHPGFVKTDIMKNKYNFFSVMTKISFAVVGKTPEEGAQTTIQLAVDPSLEKTTGKYFADCKEAPITETAKDKKLAKRLFLSSEELIGESF